MPADLAALARSVLCVGFIGADIEHVPLAALRAFEPGGITLFGRNIGRAADLRGLIAALRSCGDIAPLIAIDQEGGRVARITDDLLVAQLPAAMALAAMGDGALCERLGRQVGRDLARLGISVDLAPCADLALDARNTVIGSRSFGEAPYAVANMAGAFARGLEAGGVAAALKHFPGHGATFRDSHLELPRITVDGATLRTRDLVPFASPIAGEAASIVMTAHVVVEALDPTAPATLSAPILRGLLRDELGFDGVIATDCLEMDAIAATIGVAEGAVRALGAGADLLLVSHRLDRAHEAATAIVAAITAGRLPLERLTSAAARVRCLRERFAIMPPADETRPAGAREAVPNEPLEAARRAFTVVRGDPRLVAGRPVTVISFEGMIADGAAGPPRTTASLSAALRARGQKSENLRVSLEPDADDIDVLLAQLTSLGDRNFVLVMRRAHVYPRQLAALERILAIVPAAIVISAREPYDAALVPTARHVACIYGDEAISLAGCADVLVGRAAPGGRLPVSIERVAGVR